MKSLILIVDDVPCNLDYIEEIIEGDKTEVVKATNGTDAIRIAKEKRPDLILLDIAMPEMDGYEVCQIIKNDDSIKDIPIIFLTAKVQEEDIIKGFDAGAVDYIIKPFNYRELISRVQTHLDLKHKKEQLKNMNLKLEELVSQRTFQLKKANDDLTKAYTELTRLDYAKNEFISHINHELRTPLNGILGYTSLLEEIVDEKYHTEFLSPIQNITKRLIKVAELSLLLTELKTHDNKIERKNMAVDIAVNKAIDSLDYNEKNLVIDVKSKSDKADAYVESTLLATCVRIVLDNAIKYAPKNSRILVELEQDQEGTSIAVIDDGPGFSKKALKSLFSIFEADNLDYKSHGFGLGLATAKTILDILDGSIQVSNKDKGGAIVKINFANKN